VAGAHKSSKPSKRMRTMGDNSDSEDDHAEGVHGAGGEDDEEEARPDLAEDVERFQIHAGGSLIPPLLYVSLSRCVSPSPSSY